MLLFEGVFMIILPLSRGYFLWQATQNSRHVVLLLSVMVTYVVNLLFYACYFVVGILMISHNTDQLLNLRIGVNLPAMSHLSQNQKNLQGQAFPQMLYSYT